MGSAGKVRVVAFVPAAVAEQYAELSKRYGISRSELFRMALQRGYRSIAMWCERNQEEFSGAVDHSASVSSDRKSAASAPTPAARLLEYCRVLVEQEPDIGVEQVRAMAKAQSAVLGVPTERADEVVGSVLGQLFPAELPESGDGSGSGGAVDLDGLGCGRWLTWATKSPRCSQRGSPTMSG